MCGICGKMMFDREARISPGLVRSMADAIQHRGPDDDGYYVSGQLGLGFRRLSIIDLNTGHQPISNENGTVWVVFNGEIYNYRELRSELLAKGHTFRTQTDTEVLVHLYEEYGADLVSKLRGMFGFAIWDSTAELLMLARDRVGIKPLYYCVADRFISFGSEIKAILADPDVRAEIDPRVIDRFLTFLYLPGEETLFKNVFKLAPGSYLLAQGGKITIQQYWDLSFQQAESTLDIKTAEEQFTDLLDEAVQLHMISDVPVGFLLSGGIDSTAMLSFAADKTDQPISSYTVGFSSPGIIDERPYAKLAADTFRTEHHELTISSADFSDFMPGYIRHMEEPVCEPPAIALYYISQLARQHVKVLISGEGGDEAFAGYSNYRNLVWFERLKRALGPGKRLASVAMRGIQAATGSAKVAKYEPLMNATLDSYYFSRTANPFNFFNSSPQQFYSSDLAEVSRKQWSVDPVARLFTSAAGYGNLSKMLYVDSKSWLPDDLLVKADKMTMANSIELRVPLLDHKVLEFAARLPENFKLRRFTTKYLARKALGARVPAKILERRKAGFPVPYQAWIRKDLKNWFRSLLLDSRTLQRGYFSRNAVEKLLEDNQEQRDYSKEIFSLAVLELWHRVFLDQSQSGTTSQPSLIPAALKN
jgi:asparagine synthase (glutamine-hydrolysing)